MLLTAAENKLREGNVRDALKLFRGIVEGYPRRSSASRLVVSRDPRGLTPQLNR